MSQVNCSFLFRRRSEQHVFFFRHIWRRTCRENEEHSRQNEDQSAVNILSNSCKFVLEPPIFQIIIGPTQILKKCRRAIMVTDAIVPIPSERKNKYIFFNSLKKNVSGAEVITFRCPSSVAWLCRWGHAPLYCPFTPQIWAAQLLQNVYSLGNWLHPVKVTPSCRCSSSSSLVAPPFAECTP